MEQVQPEKAPHDGKGWNRKTVNDICQWARRNKQPLFTYFRSLDGWVVSTGPYMVCVFTQEYINTRKSDKDWPAVEVDPNDPTAMFLQDSQGSYWCRSDGVIPYGRE